MSLSWVADSVFANFKSDNIGDDTPVIDDLV